MSIIQAIISRLHLHRERESGERGQSVVLIAFAFIGILAFVGIAVDVGFIFARQSQLSSAVDAAALAGVVELDRGANEQADAQERSAQFLHSNDIPAQVISDTFANARYAFDADPNAATLGARTYALTVTWPVDLFFLRVIGRDSVDLTESATAANFPLADIYASRRVETGALSTSNQAIFGPHLCVTYGDPFSSYYDGRAQTFRARWLGNATQRTYRYRILVPDGYEENACSMTGQDPNNTACDAVRVELFDPDSINQPGNSANVVHTQYAIDSGDPATEPLSCSGQPQWQPCLIPTGEDEYVGSDALDRINLWWFRRIDETRGDPEWTGVCRNPPDGYDPILNTVTRYTLYFFQRDAAGSINRVDLATYVGESGDCVASRTDDMGNTFNRDAFYGTCGHQTDMRWVSPGAEPGFDQPVVVPTTCGQGINGGDQVAGCAGGPFSTPPGPGQGFEVDVGEDLVNIVEDATSGSRYIYLEVTTLSGGSENGFEVWAGPRHYINSVSTDVNARNVQVTNNPSAHSSLGVTVFGLGHLPMNSNYGNPVEIPLIYVGPEYAGTSVFVSNYDSDAGAQPPVTFYFDTIDESDWSMTFADGDPDPDGVSGRCIIGSCGTQWIDPPYEIRVPTRTDDCTDPDTQQDICTPFYGGRLYARYEGGQHDTYHWNISLTGLPYLID